MGCGASKEGGGGDKYELEMIGSHPQNVLPAFCAANAHLPAAFAQLAAFTREPERATGVLTCIRPIDRGLVRGREKFVVCALP